MKVIIAGTRQASFLDTRRAMQTFPKLMDRITEVVCGECRGPDTYGKRWAKDEGIPVRSMPANWNQYGNAAGPIRNEQMGDYADALLAVWDGYSKGTAHMINYMRSLNKPVYVYNFCNANSIVYVPRP